MENLDKVYAKRIAEEYAPKTTTKVVQLKKLDQKVKRPANIFAFTFGTICALIAGAGMSMIMTDFGLSGTTGLVVGIILGVVGFIGCGVNYFAYLKILKSRKEKYAFEITELAKEISEEQKEGASNMNKNENKYFNTAKKMNDALIKLLETKDYEYITIK